MNSRELVYYIINSGEENKNLAQRMEAAIKRRNMQGDKGTFSIAIVATKVAQVLEMSHAHGSIIGGEYPQ